MKTILFALLFSLAFTTCQASSYRYVQKVNKVVSSAKNMHGAAGSANGTADYATRKKSAPPQLFFAHARK